MKKTLPELVEDLSKAKSREEKKAILVRNRNLKPLKTILKGAYDKSVEWLLPPGRPPFKPDNAPIGHSNSNLYVESRRFKTFVKGGGYENMNKTRREMLFIQFLECVHETEAELILKVKDKTLDIPGVDATLINEVWPGLIVDPLVRTSNEPVKRKRGRPRKFESVPS